MGVGLSLRTGGGDLDAGGCSSGGAFAAYIPLGAFKPVNSLIFPSAREVHALLHLLRCWCSQQLELSSSPLISTGSHRAEEAQLMN